jgi:hypothetical protein
VTHFVDYPPKFEQPPDEKIVMTPGQYSRKVAYQIDPLLATRVEVKQPMNPRGDEERYGTDIWKQRTRDAHGRRGWKPLVGILLIFASIGVSNRHGEQTFAAPSQVNVVQVQYVLKSFGYSVTVDGKVGPQTTRAVKHFQKVNGLAATGVIEPKTLTLLGISTASQAVRVLKRQIQASQGALQWHDLAISVGWTEENWLTLACIIDRESHGNPNAKNSRSSATGLLQILASHHPGVDLFDPETNLQVGLEMLQSSGWAPWNLPGHQCS